MVTSSDCLTLDVMWLDDNGYWIANYVKGAGVA